MAAMRWLGAVVLFGGLVLPVKAGLYYSGETLAELPSQWRGFLLDQRTLRNIASKPTATTPASPARVRYLEEAEKLEKRARLEPDELADLGAIYVRLGEVGKALALLRSAQREHPNHFRIAANLGTAWQLQGDLTQAALALEQSVRLAPGRHQQAEELHLKLVRLRSRQKDDGLDDLFGIRYVGDKGEFEPGKLAEAQKKKLPARSVALVQQLALWLPADGRLLWQLAEQANAHGDVKNAAAMMDGCVTAFNMGQPDLRRHRQMVREAADALPKAEIGAKPAHEEKHQLAFRSKRPLVTKLDSTPLPPITDGVNVLPWDVLADTTLDARYRPTFARYLHDLAGKEVSITGFMQPLRDDLDVNAFMFIEYPVGCWFCEMPETASILYVELPPGKTATFQRSLVRVTGRLTLNATDPEDFLYALRNARISGVD